MRKWGWGTSSVWKLAITGQLDTGQLVNGNLATFGNEEHHSLATLQPLDWKRVANWGHLLWIVVKPYFWIVSPRKHKWLKQRTLMSLKQSTVHLFSGFDKYFTKLRNHCLMPVFPGPILWTFLMCLLMWLEPLNFLSHMLHFSFGAPWSALMWSGMCELLLNLDF